MTDENEKRKKRRVKSLRLKTRYTDQEVIDALRLKRGLIHLAAEYLGCSYGLIITRIREQPYLRAVLEEARGKLIDTAEERLAEAVERSESWAVTMTLKTLGKERGYVERKEHRHGGDSGAPPINIQNTVVVDVDTLPLEIRRKILEDHRRKEEERLLEGKIIDQKSEKNGD